MCVTKIDLDRKMSDTVKKHKALLIGDSIRIGYCPYVKELLKDCCEVYYPEDNCRFTQYTFVSLKNWVNLVENPEEVSVIHWNNGHWDIAHWDKSPAPLNSVEQYTEMLERIYRRLVSYCPNAEIIFTLTTAMNPENEEGAGVNPRTNSEIVRYNDAAVKVMNKLGVEVNDLFAVTAGFGSEKYIDVVHLSDDGYKILADRVTEKIKNKL